MTIMIHLKPDDEARLHNLATRQGLDAEQCASRIIQERLWGHYGQYERELLSSEQIDERLKAAAVRAGDPRRALELIEAWTVEDGDPQGTDQEWDEIQRNIERGTVDLRRAV